MFRLSPVSDVIQANGRKVAVCELTCPVGLLPVRIRLRPQINNLKLIVMSGKKLKERIEIEKKLRKKEDSIRYKFSDELAVQLRRCIADLNRLAKIDRIIEKDQLLYSVKTNRKAGYVDVVRNY